MGRTAVRFPTRERGLREARDLSRVAHVEYTNPDCCLHQSGWKRRSIEPGAGGERRFKLFVKPSNLTLDLTKRSSASKQLQADLQCVGKDPRAARLSCAGENARVW